MRRYVPVVVVFSVVVVVVVVGVVGAVGVGQRSKKEKIGYLLR